MIAALAKAVINELGARWQRDINVIVLLLGWDGADVNVHVELAIANMRDALPQVLQLRFRSVLVFICLLNDYLDAWLLCQFHVRLFNRRLNRSFWSYVSLLSAFSVQLFNYERLGLVDILSGLLSIDSLELAVCLAIHDRIVLHTTFVGVSRLGPSVLSDFRAILSQYFIS